MLRDINVNPYSAQVNAMSPVASVAGTASTMVSPVGGFTPLEVSGDMSVGGGGRTNAPITYSPGVIAGNSNVVATQVQSTIGQRKPQTLVLSGTVAISRSSDVCFYEAGFSSSPGFVAFGVNGLGDASRVRLDNLLQSYALIIGQINYSVSSNYPDQLSNQPQIQGITFDGAVNTRNLVDAGLAQRPTDYQNNLQTIFDYPFVLDMNTRITVPSVATNATNTNTITLRLKVLDIVPYGQLETYLKGTFIPTVGQ